MTTQGRRGTPHTLVTQVGPRMKTQHHQQVLEGQGPANTRGRPAPGGEADGEPTGRDSQTAADRLAAQVRALLLGLCSDGPAVAGEGGWCWRPVGGGAGGHRSRGPAAGTQLPSRLLRACVGGENNSALRSKEKTWAQAPRMLFENISDSLSFSKCLPHRV